MRSLICEVPRPATFYRAIAKGWRSFEMIGAANGFGSKPARPDHYAGFDEARLSGVTIFPKTGWRPRTGSTWIYALRFEGKVGKQNGAHRLDQVKAIPVGIRSRRFSSQECQQISRQHHPLERGAFEKALALSAFYQNEARLSRLRRSRGKGGAVDNVQLMSFARLPAKAPVDRQLPKQAKERCVAEGRTRTQGRHGYRFAVRRVG